MTTWRYLILVAAVALTAGAVRAETAAERGRYLVEGIAACGNCHTPRGPNGPLPGMELAGGTVMEEPAFTARVSNITPDRETGIGGWSDDQIIAAMREGRRPDGSIIGPPMPIEPYRDMSDTDAKAIVAYLRSIKPVRNAVARSDYRIPLPVSYGPPVGSVPDVSPSNRLGYGRYLATALGHCIECHTPVVNGRRDIAHQAFAGGSPFAGPWGVSVARNLTAHGTEGLGRWTDAALKRAIRDGIGADGTPLLPPMGFAYYRTMIEADLDALVAYLRTLPARPMGRDVPPTGGQ
ncbi:c-type cytochrome [Phreatobacter stygius]|uniref:Cytochrome c n=1 Tax=Phreatobacter stygius TaxID=1940610 RepID=A0A4D7B7E4_9HYPH|nr:cytochrome c [Phreatobacter stygius]QCI65586.1 cytochrome c [Phreatobacter stygius]